MFVTTFLALSHLGGWSVAVERLSTTSLNLEKLATDDFLLFWCVAIIFKQFLSTNNINDASRYLCVKDSAHARKAALLANPEQLIPARAAARLLERSAAVATKGASSSRIIRS